MSSQRVRITRARPAASSGDAPLRRSDSRQRSFRRVQLIPQRHRLDGMDLDGMNTAVRVVINFFMGKDFGSKRKV